MSACRDSRPIHVHSRRKKKDQVENATHTLFRCLISRVLWRDTLASRQRPRAAPRAAPRSLSTATAMQPAPQHQQQHTAVCAPCSNAAHSAAAHNSQHGGTASNQPAAPPQLPSHTATQAQQHAPAHQQSAIAQKTHAAYSISICLRTPMQRLRYTLLAVHALTFDSCQHPPYGEG